MAWRLFSASGEQVAKVLIPAMATSPYAVIMYQGRAFILESGRFVERPVWNAE